MNIGTPNFMSATARHIMESRRPSPWKRASKQKKKDYPFCGFCGKKNQLEAHDIKPFHLIKNPTSKSYSFWMKNLYVFCRRDHRDQAHCGDPQCRSYNPRIKTLAQIVTKHRKSYCKRGL